MKARKNLINWIAFNRVFAGDLSSSRRIFKHIECVEEIFEHSEVGICNWGIAKELVQKLKSQKNLEKAEKELDSLLANDYFILTIAI